MLMKRPYGIVRYSIFLVEPAALIALVISFVRLRGQSKMQSAILIAFSFAAFLTVFPQSSVFHLIFPSAMLLIGLIYAGDRLLAFVRLRNVCIALFTAWLAIGFGAGVWRSARNIFSDDYAFLQLPHFEYAIERRLRVAELQKNRDMLVAAAQRGPIFLLTLEAGFYYLVSGVHNPTSIDYPLVASMGKDGEDRLISAIRSGSVPRVCVRSYPDPLLRPAKLEEYVKTELVFQGDLGFCDLYELAD